MLKKKRKGKRNRKVKDIEKRKRRRINEDERTTTTKEKQKQYQDEYHRKRALGRTQGSCVLSAKDADLRRGIVPCLCPLGEV